MVPVDKLIGFTIAALILIVIPGPSVLFSVGRALALGKLGGFLSVLGNTLGIIPIILAVSLGLGLVVAKSVVLFGALKIVGAAYIVYLGVQAIRHRHDAAAKADSIAQKPAIRLMAEGFVVGMTNPKTLAFFIAVLPQFVAPSAGSVTWQMLELGLIFFALGLVSDSVWALSAGAARDWFARDPDRISKLSGIGGVMMIGLGAVLLLSAFESH
ncbi:MAG TPA: LysE family translocator [Microbacteriaceae bacterium]|nr:LysE family translocator [Microbacteriaceae bacterium]